MSDWLKNTYLFQIPSEYLVATGAETNNLPVEDANVQIVENVQVEQQTVQDEDVQDDGSQLRAFYDTLKEQGTQNLSFIFIFCEFLWFYKHKHTKTNHEIFI